MAALELRGGSVTPFFTADIARRCTERRLAGRQAIAMHFGQPSEGPAAAALGAADAALRGPDLGYWESAALKTRLVRHYRDTYDVELAPEQLLLTAGASAGLVGVFVTAFRAGDRIALVRPGYPAYRNTLSMLGLVAEEIGTAAANGYRIDARAVADLDPAPQGLLLASPANPTGTVTSPEDLKAIAGICRERRIRFISDEIYHGLTYGVRAATALEFDAGAYVVGSFSKFHRMPGWRLGWLVAPPAHARTIHDGLINLFLTPPVLSQHAALAAMEARAEFGASVARYARNRVRLLEALRGLGVPAAEPEGAFYLYADFGRYTRDSLRLCQRAMDEIGVGMAPGCDFDPLDGHSFVRLCFAVGEEEVTEAIRLLSGWLVDYRD